VTHTMPMQDFRQGFRSAREKATYASIKVLLEPSPSCVAGGRLDLTRTNRTASCHIDSGSN
jgi:hypothetical protein